MVNSVGNRKHYNVMDFNTEFRSEQKLFSALHIDCRSIKRQVDDISVFLRSLSVEFHVLVFSETWITYKEDARYFPGDRNEILCREKQKGGGLTIYFKDALSYEFHKKCPKIQDLTINGETLSSERLANSMNERFINAGFYITTDANSESAHTADKAIVTSSIFMAATHYFLYIYGAHRSS